MIYATTGTRQTPSRRHRPRDGPVLRPLRPDIYLVGFPLTPAQLAAADWWFVLEQQLTAPRFGFDTEGPALPHDLGRRDLVLVRGRRPGPTSTWTLSRPFRSTRTRAPRPTGEHAGPDRRQACCSARSASPCTVTACCSTRGRRMMAPASLPQAERDRRAGRGPARRCCQSDWRPATSATRQIPPSCASASTPTRSTSMHTSPRLTAGEVLAGKTYWRNRGCRYRGRRRGRARLGRADRGASAPRGQPGSSGPRSR